MQKLRDRKKLREIEIVVESEIESKSRRIYIRKLSALHEFEPVVSAKA